MNPITHALLGWAVAETRPDLTMRQRGAIVAAAVVPDLDGLGIVAEWATRDSAHPLYWWSEYHHVLLHNLFAGIACAVLLRPALLSFVAFHTHILGDLIGARGPDDFQWPIAYLYPWRTDVQLVWAQQWRLNAWPNIALTIALLAMTFVLAWRRGYSPVGLFSKRGDEAFVRTLRQRYTPP